MRTLLTLLLLIGAPTALAQPAADRDALARFVDERIGLWLDVGGAVANAAEGKLFEADDNAGFAAGLSLRAGRVVLAAHGRGASVGSESSLDGKLTNRVSRSSRTESMFTVGYALPLPGSEKVRLIGATGLAVVNETVDTYDACFLLCGDADETVTETSYGIPVVLTAQLPLSRGFGLSLSGYAMVVPGAPSVGMSASLSLGQLY